MLHLNTAAGFRKAVGEVFNEGCTQYLTNKALEKAKIDLPKNPSYVEEAKIATKLVELVGEDVVKDAYFKDKTAELIKAVDAKLGAGAFQKMKDAGTDVAKVKELIFATPPAPAAPAAPGDKPKAA